VVTSPRRLRSGGAKSKSAGPDHADHAPAVSHLRAALPVVGMVTLLAERKAALEEMIRERFRQARAAGTVANVKQLTVARGHGAA